MARKVWIFAALSSRTKVDLACAVIELALARLNLRTRRTRELIAAPPAEWTPLKVCEAELVERVAFAIPRVAARVPWRADCLVQALAAQCWLRRHQVATTLTLGIPENRPVSFTAHAWLTAGDCVVTGGEIRDYVPLTQK